MSHTYSKNHFHIVFSTKGRRKLIAKGLQAQLWSYTMGICRNVNIVGLAIGGMEDHVHALVELPPSMSVSKAVNLLKSNSSRWMNQQGIKFAWQEGFSSFAVSASNVPAVKKYVLNQEIHHRKMSFEDELLVLLRKHGIDFDPKHVFG
ncbi:MAG: IS200/IS605 family transposase [Acidobacteriia bacterium]|nr:IS200/IS605 family transposase [Terriglobia bacterium]